MARRFHRLLQIRIGEKIDLRLAAASRQFDLPVAEIARLAIRAGLPRLTSRLPPVAEPRQEAASE